MGSHPVCEAEISFQTDFFDQTLGLLFTGPTAIHVFSQANGYPCIFTGQWISMCFHRPTAIHVFSQAHWLSMYFGAKSSPLLILNGWVLVLYLCTCICIFLLNTRYHEAQFSCHLWCQIQHHCQESILLLSARASQGWFLFCRKVLATNSQDSSCFCFHQVLG